MKLKDLRELEGAFNTVLEPLLTLIMQVGSIQCVTPTWRQRCVITSKEYSTLEKNLLQDHPCISQMCAMGWLEMLQAGCANVGQVQALVNSLRGAGHLSPIFRKTAVGGVFSPREVERRKTEWGLLIHYSYAMIFQTAHPMMRLEDGYVKEQVHTLLERRVEIARKWRIDYEERYGRPLIATREEKLRAHKFLPELCTSNGDIQFTSVI